MEITAIVVLAFVALYLKWPHRVRFYRDRIVMAFGICPRCWNKLSHTGKYSFCAKCGKR